MPKQVPRFLVLKFLYLIVLWELFPAIQLIVRALLLPKKLNCNFQNGFVEIVKKDYDIADTPIVFENNNTLKKTISLAPHTISLNEGDDLAPVLPLIIFILTTEEPISDMTPLCN